MVRAIVCEGSPGGRSETSRVGFVKWLGFKLAVKEFWMCKVVNHKRKKWWVKE